MRGHGLIYLILACLWGTGVAYGHSNLSACVQHTVSVQVNKAYVDLGMELQFTGEQATRIRELIDSNRDGQVDGKERSTFGAKVLAMAETQLSLHINDSPLNLVPRYDPHIQQGSAGVVDTGGGTLHISLHFFSRMPTSLAEESVLTIHDSLFPHWPAIAGFSVVGEDGFQIHADCTKGDLSRPGDVEAELVLRAHMHHPTDTTTEGE